jgi:hypothetical protein
MSCANEPGPLPSLLSHLQVSAIKLEPPKPGFGGRAPRAGDGSACGPAGNLQRRDAEVKYVISGGHETEAAGRGRLRQDGSDHLGADHPHLCEVLPLSLSHCQGLSTVAAGSAAGARGGAAGRTLRMTRNARSWGATVRGTCPSGIRGDAVQVSPDGQGAPGHALPQRHGLPTATMVKMPPGGTLASNSTAALAGAGEGGGSNTPTSSQAPAIWSSWAVAVATSRVGLCRRNPLAGLAMFSVWCGRALL